MTHKARKRFGQNFLHDPGVIQRIVSSINPQEGDCLVEIGPGQGAITKLLLPKLKRMQVIELDRDLIEPLAQTCGPLGELKIHSADALKFDFHQLTDQPGSLRVVGNLPYNISTPILFHLIDQLETIKDLHFMLQKEVVDRMAAGPGSKTYGRLSVMLQAHCQVTPLFDIGPGAFQPAPKVNSAFVRLTPHATPRVVLKDQTYFRKLVTQAFSQRRKTIRNSLRKLMITDDAYLAANVDQKMRPEQLSLEQFAALANVSFDLKPTSDA
ncbi:MAG: 16S rRNA (adenine(1518)-N(6)/adenine(1519)-N(6))-dimethyltransferase RsmA [Candidatus Polarisedimenticolaceae bacterium]|nr:16S rRNA (adenine(1518)-N(6)/adenine(1519)-N(6))-dimethyltransferase RsmA [Candidatus Polarisedimenticolaceae bacterium]